MWYRGSYRIESVSVSPHARIRCTCRVESARLVRNFMMALTSALPSNDILPLRRFPPFLASFSCSHRFSHLYHCVTVFSLPLSSGICRTTSNACENLESNPPIMSKQQQQQQQEEEHRNSQQHHDVANLGGSVSPTYWVQYS